jgi:hypothetical protein
MLRLVFAASLSVGSLLAQGWVDRTPTNPLTGPSPRYDAAMCFDVAHGYVLTATSGNQPPDTWSWDGTAWTRRLTTTLIAPATRHSAAMVFHTPSNEVVLLSDGATYSWTGSDWLAHPGLQVPSTAVVLTTPYNVALGRDQGRNQTVLFVGTRDAGGGSIVAVGDTLLWDGFSWSLRPTATRPYPVENPSMAFDPVAGNLLLCTTDATNTQSFFWEWSGSNWQQRAFSPTPTAGGVLATDTVHNRVLLFDGSLSPTPNHTWTLANGVSAQLSNSVEPPHRTNATAAFDPVRGRMVLLGGANGPVNLPYGGSFALGDTWEFALGAGPAYSTYGSGCAGARGVPSIAAQGPSLPRIGQTFSLQVNNLPLTGPVFLFLGVSNTTYGPTPLPLSLGFLGAPGCTALASGESLFVLTNVLGSAVWQFAVPNVPNAPGATFYNQAFVFDPTANALGLTTSNGGQATIGF